MMFVKEYLGISTCGMEEKGREASRSGQREKSNCDAVLMIALADTTGSSGAGMTLQSCPRLGQDG